MKKWAFYNPAKIEFASKFCTCLVVECSYLVGVILMWDSKADTCRLQKRKATVVNQSELPDPTLRLYALQGRH